MDREAPPEMKESYFGNLLGSLLASASFLTQISIGNDLRDQSPGYFRSSADPCEAACLWLGVEDQPQTLRAF